MCYDGRVIGIGVIIPIGGYEDYACVVYDSGDSSGAASGSSVFDSGASIGI